MSRYIVGTDTPPSSRHTPARLYRTTTPGEAVLAASGTVEQMRVLAAELNQEEP